MALNCLYAPMQTGFKVLLMPSWNLSSPCKVLKKNKVSTSLKIQGFCYVADPPDLFLKSLDKTHAIHWFVSRGKLNKTPLKMASVCHPIGEI